MFNKMLQKEIERRKSAGLKYINSLYFYKMDLLEAKLEDYPNKEIIDDEGNIIGVSYLFESLEDLDVFLGTVSSLASGTKTGKKINLEVAMDDVLAEYYSNYEKELNIYNDPNIEVTFNVVELDEHSDPFDNLNNFKTLDEAYESVLNEKDIQYIGIEKEYYYKNREKTEAKMIYKRPL